MSDSNTVSGTAGTAGAAKPGADLQAMVDGGSAHPLPTDPDDTLSWQTAMARAGAKGTAEPGGQSLAPGAASAAAEAGAPSPFSALGSALSAGAGAAARAGGLPAMAMGSQPMSNEALLEQQLRCSTQGLEGPGLGADGVPPLASEGLHNGVSLVEEPTLLRPLDGGLASLPVEERPVANGLSMAELVTDRHLQMQHDQERYRENGAALIAQQLRLSEANLPDSLPLETLKGE